MKALLSTIGVLVVVAAISVLVSTQMFPVLQVTGSSMEPTLENDQILLMKKTDEFKTGEVIGFYYQSKILLKRVIGKSGDYINMDAQGNVYVNDILIEEPYVKEKSLGQCDLKFPYQVPDGKVFVLGDHRETSIDSRSKEIGCIDKKQIIGKTKLRIWPLNKVKFLN